MKKAFCHDWIVVQWWAEQVLYDLIVRYDTAESQTTIFVLFSHLKYITIQSKTYPIVTALPHRIFAIIHRFRIHHIPFLSTLMDYRNLMIIFPWLVHRLNKKIALYHPDQIVVSSFAVIKNITIPQGMESILYAHSPCMYVHNHYQANYNKLPYLLKPIYKIVSQYIRTRDQKTLHYDHIYSNSMYTATLMNQIYWISSQIQYPNINANFLNISLPNHQNQYKKQFDGDYYMMMGRLVRFARQCDMTIQLCNDLHIHLIVCGTGPDEQYLKKIAWPTIHFVWHIADITTKITRLIYAQGLINLTVESFGIATAESLALWVPVLWNIVWATKELVWADAWILVDPNDKNQLYQWFQTFQNTQRNHEQIRKDFLLRYKKLSQ
jgi:glycosyltransferase involved in cell wall biosynthesis